VRLRRKQPKPVLICEVGDTLIWHHDGEITLDQTSTLANELQMTLPKLNHVLVSGPLVLVGCERRAK
jgi:hypothetical protein